MSTITKAHEGIGEGGLGMHGNVAGEVVEDIRFGKVIEAVGTADGDGGGELAAAETIEEQIRRHVSADGFSVEAGQRPEALIDLVEARHEVDRQMKRLDAREGSGRWHRSPSGAGCAHEGAARIHGFQGNTSRKFAL
jgi:hypothetical protein